MKQLKKRRVVVVIWLAGSAGRKQLMGILRYVDFSLSWTVKLITDPKDFTNDVLAQTESEGVDGIIVHAVAQTADNLAHSKIPTVLLDFPPPKLGRRSNSIAVILDSDERIGEVAAEYFRNLGQFASYAFIPDHDNRGWSRLRERGYKRTLRNAGIKCRVYGEGKGSLASWLKQLPKPAAVMAAYDIGAQETIDACKKAGLAIPKQISVLGVDNDELICDYTSPSISSVRIDHEALGFEAARTLDALMKKPGTSRLKKILMPSDKIVERESTAPVSQGAHLVQKALTYIAEHVPEGIDVSVVANHLGVSRRLLDRRFGAVTGSSIRKAIEDSRLNLVVKKLKSTRLSINKISRLCGYKNEQRLKYVFKKRFGMSMREWRKAHGSQADETCVQKEKDQDTPDPTV